LRRRDGRGGEGIVALQYRQGPACEEALVLFRLTIRDGTEREFGHEVVNHVVPLAELREARLRYAKRLSLISPERSTQRKAQ
jgi:hypothetical protein